MPAPPIGPYPGTFLPAGLGFDATGNHYAANIDFTTRQVYHWDAHGVFVAPD